MKNIVQSIGLFVLLLFAGLQVQAQSITVTNLSNCTYLVKAEAAPPTCSSSCVVTQSVPSGSTTINLGSCNGSALTQFVSISFDTPKGPVAVGIGCSGLPSVAEFIDCEDEKRTVTMTSSTAAIIE